MVGVGVKVWIGIKVMVVVMVVVMVKVKNLLSQATSKIITYDPILDVTRITLRNYDGDLNEIILFSNVSKNKEGI